jgi:hypothetical protein
VRGQPCVMGSASTSSPDDRAIGRHQAALERRNGPRRRPIVGGSDVLARDDERGNVTVISARVNNHLSLPWAAWV